MIKTFKKTLAIMMTIVFVLSLVPTGVMAEEQEVSDKILFSNPVGIYKDSPVDYSETFRFHTIDSDYKSFFQLDFSGFEHLLADENSAVKFSVRPGHTKTGTTYKLYAFNAYILDDKNDIYIDYYSTSLNASEFKKYVTPLTPTTASALTPFVHRADSSGLQSATEPYVAIANKEILLNALNSSTDDSIVTIQIAGIEANDGRKYWGITHKSDISYVQITDASEAATPENYVDYVADRLEWGLISNDAINNVSQTLNLPAKFLGTNITWESNNAAVDVETGVVTVNPAAYTYVELKANISYETYAGETATNEKVFNIRLPKVITDYTTVGAGTYYDGDVSFPSPSGGSSATHSATITSKVRDGIAGKDKNDSYYKIQDASGNRRYDFLSPGGKTVLDRDIFEFSICIPDGCYGYYPQLTLYKDKDNLGEDTAANSEFLFKNDGVYNNRSGEKLFSWDGSKWHHVAIVAPGIVGSDGGEYIYDRTIEIYVDGILNDTIALYEETYPAPYDIKYVRTNGLCPIEDYNDGDGWQTVACYLDNIRWTYGDIDDLLPYNTKSSVASTYDIDSKADMLTVVTAGTTVKDIVDSLTIDEDAVARIYDADFNLVEDDAFIEDGYTLVVADTNGTTSERSYAYYDIRVIDDGEYAFDVPFITEADGAVNGTVKLFNNTAAKKTYKVYLAVYNDDNELLELKPSALEVETGNKGDITTENASFEDGNYAKLFIWESDDITPALSSVYFK